MSAEAVMLPVVPMSSMCVRAALSKYWAATEYMAIDEAPDSADRGGRKLDRLVCSLWRSRGFELDGVEIKISMGDWQKELKQPSKADWWWRHVHRFWLAVPAPMAVKVMPDLPTGWGLMACSDAGCKVAQKPAKHAAEPLPWTTVLGLLRASGNCGLGALRAAEMRGKALGRQEAERARDIATGDRRLREQYQELRSRVETFERLSGLNVSSSWRMEDEARAVALAKRLLRDNDKHFPSRLRMAVKDMEKRAGLLAQLATDVEALLGDDERTVETV